MGRKENNSCCITGRALSGRDSFPLFRSSLEPLRQDEGGLIWAGTETGAAQPTLPRPSAVWICVNISASTLIRGATASPPLRTFELWPQWYLREARMQYWGLWYSHLFLCFWTLVEHSKLRRIKTAAYSCFLCECRHTNVHQRTRNLLTHSKGDQTRLVI